MKSDILNTILFESCETDSYELRMNDIVPKILLKNGVSIDFIDMIDKVVPIQLICSVYANSSYYRKDFRIMILLDKEELNK